MKNNEGKDLMLRRRVSRELFMKFLYQNMILNNSWEDLNEKLNVFLDSVEDDAMEIYKDNGGRDLEMLESYRDLVLDSSYLMDVTRAIELNLSTIDQKINQYARNWTIDTLPVVDVSLMRAAIAEMLYLNDIPVYASCSEAVEIAKKYCDEDSYKYINGILGSISAELEK